MKKNKRNHRQEQAPQVQAPAPASAEPLVQAVEKLDFDAWFAMRHERIPKHHRKEILLADFGARGLSQQETSEDFDAALKQYGVKLA